MSAARRPSPKKAPHSPKPTPLPADKPVLPSKKARPKTTAAKTAHQPSHKKVAHQPEPTPRVIRRTARPPKKTRLQSRPALSRRQIVSKSPGATPPLPRLSTPAPTTPRPAADLPIPLPPSPIPVPVAKPLGTQLPSPAPVESPPPPLPEPEVAIHPTELHQITATIVSSTPSITPGRLSPAVAVPPSPVAVSHQPSHTMRAYIFFAFILALAAFFVLVFANPPSSPTP